MRAAAAWLDPSQNPHPTPLRGATFSHEWEKDARPNIPKTPKSPIMPHVFTTARLFRAGA